MDAPVIAAFITGSAAIVGPIATFYVTRARGRASQITAERLNDRQVLYEKAAKLISDGRRVLDTTWGTDAPELMSEEKQAEDAYLQARAKAIARSNTVYRELFTLTGSQTRAMRFDDARRDQGKNPNYQVRCLSESTSSLPLIDILVVDGEHVLLSFLSSDSVRQGYQYIYVRSTAVAEHYTEYFDECWRVARSPDTERKP